MDGSEVFPGFQGLLDLAGGGNHDFAAYHLPDPGVFASMVLGIFWPGLVTVVSIIIGYKVVVAVYSALAGR